MEEALRGIAIYVALATEAAAVVIIAFGALQAVIGLVKYGLGRNRSPGGRKQIWMGLSLRFAHRGLISFTPPACKPAARKGCEDISPGLSEAIPGVTATLYTDAR